jgi:hypothetical protein
MKRIPEFSDYSITTDGRVWSHKTKRWLKAGQDPDGHLRVVLYNGRMNTKKVHRLVLETYAGPCPVGMMCRHLDGNSANNKLNNLCWGTNSENQNTAGHFGEQHHNTKLTNRDRRLIIYEYATGLFTQKRISIIHKIDRAIVGRLAHGLMWPFVHTPYRRVYEQAR